MQWTKEKTDGLVNLPAVQWYAAYVKHQHERKATDLLQRKGIEAFLPEQKVMRHWKDRNKELFLPLFPGYLFLHTNLQDKLAILNTPGVFFIVENGGRACPISREEIESIRRVTEAGLAAQPHEFVTEGDRVRVRSGPLSGVVGILTQFKNQYRVVLAVGLLQKAVSVEVNASNVERISKVENNPGAAPINRTGQKAFARASTSYSK